MARLTSLRTSRTTRSRRPQSEWNDSFRSSRRRRRGHQTSTWQHATRRLRSRTCPLLCVLQATRSHGQAKQHVVVPTAWICLHKPSDSEMFANSTINIHKMRIGFFCSSKPSALHPPCLPLRSSGSSFLSSRNSSKDGLEELDQGSRVWYSSVSRVARRLQVLASVVPVQQP